MQAYLIDPFKQTVTEVQYSGDYTEIYKLIDCDLFTTAQFNEFGDTVFVDDEGLISGKYQEFFLINGYPQPLAGKGLILGCDNQGESVEPSITLDQAKALIDFPLPFMLQHPSMLRHFA